MNANTIIDGGAYFLAGIVILMVAYGLWMIFRPVKIADKCAPKPAPETIVAAATVVGAADKPDAALSDEFSKSMATSWNPIKEEPSVPAPEPAAELAPEPVAIPTPPPAPAPVAPPAPAPAPPPAPVADPAPEASVTSKLDSMMSDVATDASQTPDPQKEIIAIDPADEVAAPEPAKEEPKAEANEPPKN